MMTGFRSSTGKVDWQPSVGRTKPTSDHGRETGI